MSTITKDRTDIDIGFPSPPEPGEGEGNPRCLWHFGVCAETPTKKIVWRGSAGAQNRAETLCALHYALELARFVEVHTVGCAGTVAEHFVDFGDL